MKLIITTLGVLAMASTLSLAQDKPTTPPAAGADAAGGKHQHASPEEQFKKLDTNNDGFLSLDEFKASPRGQKDPAKAEEFYKKMDKAGDGKVTLEEFVAAHKHEGGRGGKGGKGGAPAAN